MKQLTYFMLMMVVSLSTACSTGTKFTDEPSWPEIRQQLENRQFTITIREMIPMQGASQQVTSEYTLSLKGDTVISHLPYFGRAYSAPYGGGNVFSFEAPLLSYSLEMQKADLVKISFRTRTPNDTFIFYVDVFNNGKASVRVSATNRQGISYLGEIRKTD